MQKATESPQIYLLLPFTEQKAKELGHFFHMVVSRTHLCLWQRPKYLAEFCMEGGGQEDVASPSDSTSGTVQG